MKQAEEERKRADEEKERIEKEKQEEKKKAEREREALRWVSVDNHCWLLKDFPITWYDPSVCGPQWPWFSFATFSLGLSSPTVTRANHSLTFRKQAYEVEEKLRTEALEEKLKWREQALEEKLKIETERKRSEHEKKLAEAEKER